MNFLAAGELCLESAFGTQFLDLQKSYTTIFMDGEQVELTIKLSNAEINFFRQAITKRASDKDWQQCATLLLQSLRARSSRFTVRELGRSYNAAV
jgi:hypothetical protein